MECPHCKAKIELPPVDWLMASPWHCSHCGELFIVDFDGLVVALPEGFKPLSPILNFEGACDFVFHYDGIYYAYVLCDPHGIPFYVGMGSRRRCFAHEEEAARGRNDTEKHQRIRLLHDCGQCVWYHFLVVTADKNHANNIEAYWIRKWKLRCDGGLLLNRKYEAWSSTMWRDEEKPFEQVYRPKHRQRQEVVFFRYFDELLKEKVAEHFVANLFFGKRYLLQLGLNILLGIFLLAALAVLSRIVK